MVRWQTDEERKTLHVNNLSSKTVSVVYYINIVPLFHNRDKSEWKKSLVLACFSGVCVTRVYLACYTGI